MHPFAAGPATSTLHEAVPAVTTVEPAIGANVAAQAAALLPAETAGASSAARQAAGAGGTSPAKESDETQRRATSLSESPDPKGPPTISLGAAASSFILGAAGTANAWLDQWVKPEDLKTKKANNWSLIVKKRTLH